MEGSVVSTPVNTGVQNNVRGMQKWLKFLGIVQIVAGILQALTLFGILWAWLPIWMGVILNAAGNKAQVYVENGDPQALVELTGKLKLYFIINGIMMIISLVAVAISLLVLAILAAVGVLSLPSLLESWQS